MDAVVSVEGLRKRYGSLVAVENVSFAVAEGEIFGLLGPNGAGKTTTVECLQGLRRPDGGRLRVLGLDPQSQAGELRGRVGGQLQESALPDRMKVWEALDLFASLSPRGVARRRCGPSGISPRNVTPRSPACPAVSGSGCSSRWRWRTGRRWCSWMR